MARGWESKAVEDQQMDRERRLSGRADAAPVDPARDARRRGLELARHRAADDLTRATNAVHREMLRQSIAALDAQLAALDAS